MKATQHWGSGVSRIWPIVFGLILGVVGTIWYATSRPPRVFFISLPGGLLLCAEGRLGRGFTTFVCSTGDGFGPAPDSSGTKPSSGVTLQPLSLAW